MKKTVVIGLFCLQVSVAYAVWIGIGVAGAVLIICFSSENRKVRGRMVSVMLIVAGVVGLKAFP